MIARPKISQNEWKTAEIGAFEGGHVALLCCPVADGARPERRVAAGDGEGRLARAHVLGPREDGRGDVTTKTSNLHFLGDGSGRFGEGFEGIVGRFVGRWLGHGW